MNKNAKKWVKALRSGKFRQTREKLRARNGACCCLGVACEVAIAGGVKVHREWSAYAKGYAYGGEQLSGELPEEVRQWLGLRISDGVYRNSRLTYDNDTLGLSFKQIADIIESEPEGLFEGGNQ